MSGMTRDAAEAAGTGMRVEPALSTHGEEASALEFRRRWAPPPPARSRRDWARFGVSGRLSAGWVLVLMILAAFAFGSIPGSIHDRNDALLLQTQGRSLLTEKVEVHVSYVNGKGGGYYAVDGVRVILPGSPDPVELEAIGTDLSAPGPIYDRMTEGWQTPTAKTGYLPPLTVRVQRDANDVVVTAMTQVDYEYELSAYEPEGETVVGVLCLVVAGLSLGLNRLRLQRRALRRGR